MIFIVSFSEKSECGAHRGDHGRLHNYYNERFPSTSDNIIKSGWNCWEISEISPSGAYKADNFTTHTQTYHTHTHKHTDTHTHSHTLTNMW